MDISKSIDAAIQHIKSGRLRDAEDICRKIIRKKPNNADALHLLGVVFDQDGKHEAAIVCLKKALQIDPKFADAYSNLGIIYQKQRQFDEAIRCFIKALRLQPQLAKTWFNLGILLHDSGKIDEAFTAYQQALNLNFRDVGIMNNLGLIFEKKLQFDKATVYYGKALEIAPDDPEAHFNMGNVLRLKNDLDEAMAYYKKALELNPEYVEVYNNLGLIFHKKGRFEDATICYQKTIAQKPCLVEAYNNLGNLLKDTGRAKEAISSYQKVLELDPHNAGAYNNLAAVMQDQGRIHEAEDYYRKAIQLNPDSPSYFSNLLLLLNYSFRHDAQSVFEEHLRFSGRLAEPLYPVVEHYANDPSPSRRLRIGYVSPDFRRHSVNFFIEPVLVSHSHEEFEIFCYSDVIVPDTLTERLQGYADQWRNIAGMQDEEVAGLIRKDQVDILIDLAGQTGWNRMLVFARKPAPVQVNWLGYPNTTGLKTMDYRIVDGFTDPPGMTDPYYTEQLIRMRESFICYQPDQESPAVGDLPALQAGHITFGSFNNFAKISGEVIALWADILQSVQNSHLLLKAKIFADTESCHYVRGLFTQRRVDPDRLELVSHVQSYQGHLNLYSRIDIGLDPFPYNGTTTTCEALWMGVPVVTLSGTVHAGRVGTSIMTNIGLPDIIAETRDMYLKTALELSRDLTRLQSLRKTLRHRMTQSPLTDKIRFTMNLENTFRSMWEKWCRVVAGK